MHDVHTHFIPEDVILWIKDNKKAINAKWEQRGSTKNDFLVINDKWAFELKDLFINSSLYLRAQEKVGINHALVSPVPQLFLYDFPEEITAELCSVYNRALKKMTISQNDRLYGLATIPLNNPLMAAEELHKSMSLGLKGAIVGPGCNGKRVDGKRKHPT